MRTNKIRSPLSNIPEEYDNLELILNKIWEILASGPDDGQNPAHTPSLATVDKDGFPKIRTLVLRQFDKTTRILRFHTDARSEKVKELFSNPNVAIHIYDPLEKIQIRLDCIVQTHQQNNLSRDAWTKTKTQSRLCYQITSDPGKQISNPYNVAYDATKTDDGQINFLVLHAVINKIEWLYLHHRGHRRAEFVWIKNHWNGAWLVP